MTLMEKKTTFGLIVGTRGFFNPALAAEGRKQLLAKPDALGYDYIIPPEDATPNGAIETLKDAKVCAEVFQKIGTKSTVLLWCCPISAMNWEWSTH